MNKTPGFRPFVVDTAAHDELIFAVDTARARKAGDLDTGFDRVVRDLVMGVPVARSELERWGIAPIAVFESQAELLAREAQLPLALN